MPTSKSVDNEDALNDDCDDFDNVLHAGEEVADIDNCEAKTLED